MEKQVRNKEVENKVDKTLELAENLKKQEIKPYFYTRLMAKIESDKRGKASEPAIMGLSRRFAVGLVALLLVVNSLTVYFTVFGYTTVPKSETIDEKITRQENIEKIADEYFGGADYYNNY